MPQHYTWLWLCLQLKNKLLNWHIRIFKASNGNGVFNGPDLPEDCSLDQIISHLFKWNDALKSSSN